MGWKKTFKKTVGKISSPITSFMPNGTGGENPSMFDPKQFGKQLKDAAKYNPILSAFTKMSKNEDQGQGQIPKIDIPEAAPQPATLPEFDLARKRLKSDYLQANENMKDAMSRRFARIGGGPSGSQIKMEAEQGGKLEEARQKAEEGLLMDELQTKQKIRALDQVDRQFQLDKRISEFNMQLSQMEANRPTDLFGSLLGPTFSMEPNQPSILSPVTRHWAGIGKRLSKVKV